MAKPSKWPTTQLFSNEFVNCAGSILFCREPSKPLQICYLHHATKDEWLLPKGRQDMGESLPTAAVRETYEETGYPCQLLPLNMLSRAPEGGQDMKDVPRRVQNCTEPFMVTMRHVSERDIKFIWWFVTIAQQGAAKRDETQMLSENFESMLFDVDIHSCDEEELEQAVSRLTYENDRAIAKAAIRLVFESFPEWFSKGIPHSLQTP